MTVHPMDMDACALAGLVRAGTLDARDVAEAALDRAAARNPGVNAICAIDPAATRAEAHAVAARLARGEDLPLAGVPVVIKDNIWVAGRTVTQGSRLFADFVAPADAAAVARLRAAGAVILGIGACSEFACKGVTATPLHGATRNPCDPALTPGGSSGGCAAAVAAGIAPLALGTDAGGSSRRPPAHVGIVGFKPSQDAIPYGPGFAEPFWGTSVLAPIARSVADAAAMFAVLAGLPPARDPDPDLHDLRIAYAPTMGLPAVLDADVEAVCEAALTILSRAGHRIERSAPRWPSGVDVAALMPLQSAGLAALYGDRWRSDPALFDPDLGVQIEAGLALSGADVARALFASQATRDALRGFLGGVDLLLTPTTPCAAWPLDRLGPAMIGGAPAAPRDHAAFTPQANHAGVPAISIPCGTTAEGLPLGLQIIAGAGRDRLALAAARAFETLFQDAGATAPFQKAT
jgi:aspartyl-tRNA(Asn)/glutamyl-tRNA(Gln) amidotransferase subunit A